MISELGDGHAVFGLAEKIRQAVRQPLAFDGREMAISCSLGVAVYPDDGTDEITLTKGADEAMYLAKASGRDCVRFRSGQHRA